MIQPVESGRSGWIAIQYAKSSTVTFRHAIDQTGGNMRIFRDDTSLRKDSFGTPVEYYLEIRRGFREKANHNKKESQFYFCVIICFTLAAPLFVTMADGWFWGKLVPATLSVLAAGATAWLQLRKPQRLWTLYRRAQRELEREMAAYDFHLGDYDEVSERDKLLASRVSEIAFRVHQQWEGLVPEPDNLAANKPSVSTDETEDTNAS
jgi:hypothetical protein